MFLVGFMGSGKTSVGAELARRHQWDFVDLDLRIESRSKKAIADIFRDEGESGFRHIETAVLRELMSSQKSDTVIALGGGAFVQAQNRALIGSHPTVFLDAPVDELWRRCSQDPSVRPLRQDSAQFARLHEQRLPHYRQATITVNTGAKDVTSVCMEIEQALQQTEPEA